MKVVELRTLKQMNILTRVLQRKSNTFNVRGCLFDRLQKCEYIRCSGRFRRDGNEIILKCTSRKRKEVKNA